MDAIGLIVNACWTGLPDLPQNMVDPHRAEQAAVPVEWTTQGLWTQWRGVQQDPIFRNLTEVMGVYMDINLRAKSPAEGLYHSNASIRGPCRGGKSI